MKHQFGLPFDFLSFHDLALSAKMRVMEYEPQINWSSYFEQLAHAMATARMTHAACGNWYGVSYAFIMSSARRRMANLGITSVSIRSQLMFLHGGRSGTRSLNTYIKKGFQSQVLEQLVKSVSYNHEYVLRDKLKRWRIAEVPEGILARKAVKRLRLALDVVPVENVFVLCRTWFNGWCSARSFQVKQAHCLFRFLLGSGGGCNDSIEHYCHCPSVAGFASHRLHLPQANTRKMLAFMRLGGNTDDDMLTSHLLLLCAVHSATNCLRFSTASLGDARMYELLLQCVHQGANQSSSAQNIVHKLIDTRAPATSRLRARNCAWPRLCVLPSEMLV